MNNTARSQPVEQALIELGRALPDHALITDREVLETYAGDESEATPVLPDAIARVSNAQEVSAALTIANRHRLPVTPRGAGTGRTGGAVPVQGGLILSFEQWADIKDISTENLSAVVEPGVVLGALHQAVEAQGLFYPPDPNSLDSCTLGGNVAENAAGPRTLRYGTTRDYVQGMNVVTAAGQPLRLGKQTVKGVTGYDLTSLVVGSEGTLAVVTEINLKLIPKPQAVVTLLVLLPDLLTAGHAVSAALRKGFLPRCIEMLDAATLALIRPSAQLPIPDNAQAMLLVELDGEEQDLERQLERCGNAMDEAGALEILVAKHGGERERLWSARRELSYVLRQTARYKLAEDVVVPRNRIPDLLQTCNALSEQYRVPMPSYGHAGDGNIHVNFLWNDPEERPRIEPAVEQLFRTVLELGGTLSGEHGIGLSKAPYLPLELSAAQIELQQQIKQLFDPRGILNPGKIFPSSPVSRHGAC